jgi:hypothetical protein
MANRLYKSDKNKKFTPKTMCVDAFVKGNLKNDGKKYDQKVYRD